MIQSSVSDFQIRYLLGLGFVLAFFTLHIGLVPSLEAEYQPVVFLLLGIVVAFAGYRDIATVGPAFVLLGLMVAGVWHASQGTLQFAAMIRCMIGPVFAGVSPLFLRFIPRAALAVIIYIHVLIAIGGMVAADLTAGVLMQFGLRGAQYGWYSFMASEPSYAALNLVSIVALFSLRDSSILSGHLGLMSGLILLATLSITGIVFGVILVVFWLCVDRRGLSSVGKLLALATVVAVLVFVPLGVGERLQQAAARFDVIVDSLGSLDLLGLISGEASGAWRILSNSLAAIGVVYAPFGTGGLGLEAVFQRPMTGASSNLIGVILASEVYLGLQTDFVAATPFFNYISFGGLLAAIPLLCFVIYGVRCVFRAPLGLPCKLLYFLAVICGLVWQTALTSPGWWLLLGAGVRVAAIRRQQVLASSREGGLPR